MKRSAYILAVLFVNTLMAGQSSQGSAGLDFRPDRASAERVKAVFIAKVGQQNPAVAQILRRDLSAMDVSAVFEQAAAPLGLHDGNLADAVAARSLMLRIQDSGSLLPSPAEVAQERGNAAQSFAAESGPRLEAKRRELAEVAQIGFIVAYQTWSAKRRAQSGGASQTQIAPAPSAEARVAPAGAQPSGNFVRPIGAATQSAGNFTPMGSTIHVEAWYLYPNGIATDCSALDPATLTISLPALRSMRDCTGARWRRVGGKVQIQVSDRDPWNDALEQQAQRAGTRLQFVGETAGGAGTMPGGAGVAVNSVMNGRLLLSADGRIQAVLSNAVAIGGAGVGGGSSSSRRVDGTYTINGYVMTITAQNGQTYSRLVTVVHEAGKVYVYFQGNEYWPPGR